MTFLAPLGFLALLAIPVLIIIYIIKSKFTEQVIASTYLWTLSERFLKRKNPIQRITGIISLILQILAVVFIALAIAHPVFILKGKANDYCFILDGSGSMNVVQNGETRFETGKERISKIISSAADGSTFTLITTGNTTDVVLQNCEDKKTALRRLSEVKPAFVASDFSNATTLAQNLFTDNPACKFYIVTDREVSATNAEAVNVAQTVVNYALDEVAYAYSVNGDVTVTGKAYSYGDDARITVRVFADGGDEAVASEELDLTGGEGKIFTLTWSAEEEGKAREFSSLKVEIAADDDLGLDNRVVLYNSRNDARYSTLIVSDEPFFINATLASRGTMQRTVVSTAEYNENMTGYGLYVFENFTPSKMPSDGAVWFINPDTGVDGTSGFSRRGVQTLNAPANLQLSTSTSTRVRNLLKNTSASDATGILQYVQCGLYRSFTTLMTCNGDPVVFAGNNGYGNREVVFALDLHTSDFAMSYNGRILMYNLIDYTFPVLVDETSLYCGDSLEVNVLANCTGIRVESPSGKAEYLDVSSASTEYELTEVGEYVITATVGNERRVARVYSQLPAAERVTQPAEASFIISGEPSTQKRDGKYEDLLYAFIILAVIVVADWLVYCYEQYQLR